MSAASIIKSDRYISVGSPSSMSGNRPRHRLHSHSANGLRQRNRGEAANDPSAVADVNRKAAVVGEPYHRAFHAEIIGDASLLNKRIEMRQGGRKPTRTTTSLMATARLSHPPRDVRHVVCRVKLSVSPKNGRIVFKLLWRKAVETVHRPIGFANGSRLTK
jgi:hypothetical protein